MGRRLSVGIADNPRMVAAVQVSGTILMDLVYVAHFTFQSPSVATRTGCQQFAPLS